MKFFPLVTAGNCATWPKQIVRFFIASRLADRRDARFFWLRIAAIGLSSDTDGPDAAANIVPRLSCLGNDHGKSTQHQKTATERPGKPHQGRKAAGKVKIQTR